MLVTFRPYQLEAERFGDARDSFGLFMDMRLGKSRVAIRCLKKPRPSKEPRYGAILLVNPLSVFESWQEQLEDEGEEFYDFRSSDKAVREKVLVRSFDKEPKRRRYFLTTYETLLRTPELAFMPWGGVILDESTYIKNPKAQITKLCLRGFREAHRRVVLTGLPNPESSLDVWTQAAFLKGQFMQSDNFWEWRSDNAKQEAYGYDWYLTKAAYKQMVKELKTLAFTMSRKKAGLNVEKVRVKRYVDLNSKQRRCLRALETDWEYKDWDTQYGTERNLWYRRVAGGFSPDGLEVWSTAKADELARIITTEFPRQPVVCWFAFRAELELAQRVLAYHKVKCSTILGGMGADRRKLEKRKVVTGETTVLLSTVDASTYGADFSVSDVAIYYSNQWSHETRKQTEDRILTVEDSGLLIIDIVARESADVDVADTIVGKSFTSRALRDSMIRRRQAA